LRAGPNRQERSGGCRGDQSIQHGSCLFIWW
jgi:hypothetical protein